ncbi:MAG: LPP20 family lipoprotein [Bacteroidota bacterium]
MRYQSVLRLSIVLAFFVVGCSTSFEGENDPEVPAWLQKLPREEGKIFAIGISGPTRYLDDGRRYASDDARKELAKSFSSRVRDIMLQYDHDNASQQSEASSVSVTSSITDFVVANSQIVSMWIDKSGVLPKSEPGTIYALASIEANKSQQLLDALKKN